MDGLICTRATAVRENAKKDFVSVSYTSHKKKQKTNDKKLDISVRNAVQSALNPGKHNLKAFDAKDARRQQEIQMKRARFDVIKFGMSGFDGAQGQQAKIALAVKLGAKPPKKKNQNYKQLILERKKAKMEADKKQENFGIGKNFGNRRSNRKREKEQDLLSVYGKVQKATKATITNNKKRP